MASFQELAVEYANRLRSMTDRSELRQLATELNSLTYAKDSAQLSTGDKQKIVNLIITELSPPRSAGHGPVLKEADNKRYLELVKLLKELTG
jgi:hypothetical protein